MTASRPGVLFLVNSLCFGGAEKHAISLLNQLDVERFRLSLAYLKPDEALLPQLEARRLENVLSLQVQRKFDWGAIRRLARYLRKSETEVIVCSNGYPVLHALLAARLTGRRIKVAEVFHTTTVLTRRDQARMALYRMLFRHCDLLVYVSSLQRDYWRGRGFRARRDTVIHNGIDVEHFTDRYDAAQKAQLRARYGFHWSDYVIGICAALRPEKAHRDLLHAVHRLRARGVPAKCLIIGDGSERRRIDECIDALQLGEHAVITGFQADVRPCIAACDVMVLASHAVETFSIAALESMSLGKPFVLTRIGGAEEQVTDGVNGFLYEPGDLDALTQHLSLLAAAERRRPMSTAAARIVRERFDRAGMIAAFENELAQLTSLQRPPSHIVAHRAGQHP